MNGSAPNAMHRHNPINVMTRQAGSARRSHVQYANAFHAWTAMGWALRNKSGASLSRLGAGAALTDVFSTLGVATVRNDAGMVRFAPQYVHVMRT
jgi:hypothetical protein